MHRSDVLHTLDARVHARSILQHPFYIAWERGALTRAQLAIYARTYYPHVHAFPRYLEATIERTDDAASRVELERNLADELFQRNPINSNPVFCKVNRRINMCAAMFGGPKGIRGVEIAFFGNAFKIHAQ